ncbi:DUF6461 domain-containing protein [Streptomyces sparsogenes]|uniref:Uncharacterized protein n=1 Tax=Streptomyces sparsogenes DSM 40356 TaxID=1331668 RepID=A0A1R1SCE1_9ACTN|nr:DUF6461 domain-containing protein [Streptomyces sparsogenes]OMI35689.1 hypothetical protein SPAR_29986 [Streptomyces sparsogenes DSM 40356]
MASALFEVLGNEEFCVTALRGLDEAEVLSRLGTTASSVPYYRMEDVISHVGFESEAVQVHAPGGDWVYLFDAIGSQGWSQSAPVLLRLCRGTEAVSVCKIESFSTKVVLARDGVVIAEYDTWLDERPSGPEADGLERILTRAGFFLPPEDRPDGFRHPRAALEAVEEEFGLRVDPAALAEPLPTVTAPVLRG